MVRLVATCTVLITNFVQCDPAIVEYSGALIHFDMACTVSPELDHKWQKPESKAKKSNAFMKPMQPFWAYFGLVGGAVTVGCSSLSGQ